MEKSRRIKLFLSSLKRPEPFDPGGLVAPLGPPGRGGFKMVVDGVSAGSAGGEDVYICDVAAASDAVKRGNSEQIVAVGVHAVGEEEFDEGGSSMGKRTAGWFTMRQIESAFSV